MSWQLYAQRIANPVDGREFMNFGSEVHVRRGYGGDVQAVHVTLDPEGMYWGWVETGGEGEPTMIQPHPGMFRMQFPYGPAAEATAGRGEIVRLSVMLA